MSRNSVCEYTIIFDGGSRGNPGDAYGSFVILEKEHKSGKPVRLRFGVKTNNEAEYLTLLSSLETLLSNLTFDGIPASSIGVILCGDSKLVLNQINGEWKTKNERLKVLNASARHLMSKFSDVQCQHQERSAIVRRLGH